MDQQYKNVSLTIDRDDPISNDFLLVFNDFGSRPNRIIIHDSFTGENFDKIVLKLSPKSENVLSEMIPTDDGYNLNERFLSKITDTIWISCLKINKNLDSYTCNEICIFYKDPDDKKIIDKFILDISNFVFEYESKDEDKINTISISNSSFELDPLSSVDNIDSIYSKEICKNIDLLVKEINSTDSGISIFNGRRKLGKTTTSKYISSNLDRMSIFIPNNMIDHTINNPEFRNFLRKFKKIMIVIDDCEFNYPNNTKSNYLTNNMLQLVDGFLSDTVNVHFLLIFNDGSNIDPIIRNSNKFISELTFKEGQKNKKSKIIVDFENTKFLNSKRKNSTLGID